MAVGRGHRPRRNSEQCINEHQRLFVFEAAAPGVTALLGKYNYLLNNNLPIKQIPSKTIGILFLSHMIHNFYYMSFFYKKISNCRMIFAKSVEKLSDI